MPLPDRVDTDSDPDPDPDETCRQCMNLERKYCSHAALSACRFTRSAATERRGYRISRRFRKDNGTRRGRIVITQGTAGANRRLPIEECPILKGETAPESNDAFKILRLDIRQSAVRSGSMQVPPVIANNQ